MPGLSVAYPLINGHRFSYSSLEIILNPSQNPRPMLGIKSINYSEELEPGDVYGTRSNKLGRTRGKQNASCDFEMYRAEWEILKATLGVAGVGYGETSFDITATYSEAFTPTITDMIIGARITKAEFSNSEGTDASSVKLTCNVMYLVTNSGIGFHTIAVPIKNV